MIKWKHKDDTHYLGFLHYALDTPNEAEIVLIWGLVKLDGKWHWGWPIAL